MHQIGIDIGSTYIKYCVVSEKNEIQDVYMERTPIRQKIYFEKKILNLKKTYPNSIIVSCGYGRKNVGATKCISELMALTKGSYYIVPTLNTVLDIGGQDTKLVCHKAGKLKEFFVNDKCAAGSGIFFDNICKLLEVNYKDIDLTNIQQPEVHLSSVCAVFAQSEIVELLANNISVEKIIQAVIWQILIQAKSLLGKVKESDILLSGGLSQIKGIEKFAEHALERKCYTSIYSPYFSAIGCSLT